MSPNTVSSASRHWWQQPFANVQTNLQEIDATMDVEQALDVIEAHGANSWLLNTGGIASQYPSKLPFQTPNPYLADRPSGDLTGDAVAAAHKRNIRLICRMDFSKVSSRIAAEHPEWLFVSPTGKPQIYNTLYSVCPCGEYYQERTLDVVDEILSLYPVDGFFMNWFGFSETDYSRIYHGVCHCENCQRKFAEFSGGKELPNGKADPTYPEWLRFSTGVVRALSAKISGHVEARRPDAAMILSRGSNMLYHEANNAFGRELWPHATSEFVSAHVTGLPEIPILVNCAGFVDMPYRMAAEQPELFAQYLIQAAARGANPSTYIMGPPGRIPYKNFAIAGEVTRFYRDHRDMYAQLKPGSTIAVVRQDRVRSADPGYEDTIKEFRGIYKMLNEKHLPFDVISLDLIAKMHSEGNLARYALVIVPDVGSIGRDGAAALDAFVRKGGNVVLTGGSGIGADGGAELATGPAMMRFGGPLKGQELWATYVTPTPQTNMGEFAYEAPIIPVYGNYTRLVWKKGIDKRGMVLPQAPFGPPEKAYGNIGSGEPGAASSKRGGTVLQMPWSVGHTYHEFGTTEVRDYFLNEIADLTGEMLKVELPEQCEVIVSRDNAGLVIHVINQTGYRRKSFGPHIPLQGGRISVKDASGTAEALVSNMQLKTSSKNGVLAIDLPAIDLFEVIRVSMAA